MADPLTRAPTTAEPERERVEQALARLRRVARLMDEQFELPLVRWRVGLDPLIGLIPGGGDWITWIVSVYIFWQATRLGAKTSLLVRMAANVAVDLLTGYVPVLGDLADAAFKANTRNVDLLFAQFDARPSANTPGRVEIARGALARRERPSVKRWLVGVGLVLVLLLIAAAPIALLWWLLAR